MNANPVPSTVRSAGFALVLVLSMTALVTLMVMALAAISSRQRTIQTSSQAQAEAQANARLAMQLAIGQLQRQLGPDQKITAPADQLADASDPSRTRANAARSRWTGVYDAWPAGVKARPTPVFRSWLVSGNDQAVRNLATAETNTAIGQPPSGRPQEVPVLGDGSTGGIAAHAVNAPLVTAGSTGAVAWWTADENIKAMAVERGETLDPVLAHARMRNQAAPRRAVEWTKTGAGAKPLQGLVPQDPRARQIVDWPQLGLISTPPGAHGPLVHDLSTVANGLLVDVRNGGLRRDLSMYLERNPGQEPRDALYTVGGEAGINMQELWCYYRLNRELRTTPAPPPYTTGGRAANNAPYLQMEGSPSLTQSDDEYHFKQPVIIGYKTLFSFNALPVTVGSQTVRRLRLVVDPIVTYWNPLDVPVVIPTTSFNSIKYWSLPYDLRLRYGSREVTVSIGRLLGGGTDHYVTLRAGMVQQLVLKPGEVLMVSQAANTPITQYNAGLNFVDGKAGFNFGGGVAIPMRDLSGNFIDLLPTDQLTFALLPNGRTNGGPNGNAHTRWFSLIHHEFYVGHDRTSQGDTLGTGGMFIDWDFGNRRLGPTELRSSSLTDVGQAGTKGPGMAPGNRLFGNNFPNVFPIFSESQTRPIPAAQFSNAQAKEYFMLVSFLAKTETSSLRRGRFLSRFNPKAFHNDFYDLSNREMELSPYEFRVEAINSSRATNIEVSPAGNSFFGGGRTASDGVSFITTHTVSREPMHSIAAFQHSFANGFNTQKPKVGYATLNAREPMLPHIGHAIGNSMASSMLAPDRTEGTMPPSRPLADHSYLANEALFDTWFFSGVAPRQTRTFSPTRNHRQVAEDFFRDGKPLANANYLPRLGAYDAAGVINLLFRGTLPTADAHDRMAAFLGVQGMFNVNSTSIEAWKAVLAGLKGQPVTARVRQFDAESLVSDDSGVPVISLQGPEGDPLKTADLRNPSVSDPAQWVGRRVLDEADIEALARAITREVRRRGPFLSLADFVNRRVGTDKDLARAGAIQAALDSSDVPINAGYNEGSRSTGLSALTQANRALAFPEAETGAAAYGIPGIVKQADVLTPIAPGLSARSDTFRVRAYGEKVSSNGRVVARAWCEAVVERQPDYVSGEDTVFEKGGQLVPANRNFGRRFRVVSFRWLAPEEV